jgi:hypothetical protein
MVTISVRRQILDVEVFGEESAGLLLRDRLPAVCADVVAPALEAGLAAADLEGRRICIDHISIDVRGVEIDALERELAVAVRRGLDEYLRDHPPHASREDPADSDADDRAVRVATEGESIDDALVMFLGTGRLPWSLRMPPGEAFEPSVLRGWRERGTGGPTPALRARLAEVFREPEARRRVVLQFTPPFAVALLRGMSPEVAAASGSVLAVLTAADAVSASVRRSLSLALWDAALIAAANDEHPSEVQLVRQAASAAALSEHEQDQLRPVFDEVWPAAASALVTRPEEGEARPSPVSRGDGGPGEETEGILVEAAGLVLVHPYLSRFFAGLGVAEGDELIDAERAVTLLHLLATGERTAPEYRVTLAKALCGIALDQPVPADLGLSDAEADEANALLKAVVEHWGVLGDASPDGLREGFLSREGILSVDAWGDWLLRVEKQSIDILLDDLPWSTSIVELPWMARRLIVEWR